MREVAGDPAKHTNLKRLRDDTWQSAYEPDLQEIRLKLMVDALCIMVHAITSILEGISCREIRKTDKRDQALIREVLCSRAICPQLLEKKYRGNFSRPLDSTLPPLLGSLDYVQVHRMRYI